MTDKAKPKITKDILVMMEKASRLKVVTEFERRLLADRVSAVDTYSMAAVITTSQYKVIEDMAIRYDLSHFKEMDKCERIDGEDSLSRDC